MFNYLLKARYLTAVIAILALLDAVAFLVMGAKSAVRAYTLVWKGVVEDVDERPGIELLHSLDFLFVAMVLLVLAIGIAKLFLLDPAAKESLELPAWLQVESIGDLKVLLWETILTTLLIVGLSDLTAGVFVKLDWTALLIPVSILALSLSLYVMKKA